MIEIEITSSWYLKKHPVGFPNTIEFKDITEFVWGDYQNKGKCRLLISLAGGSLTEITTLNADEMKDFYNAYTAWCYAKRVALPKVTRLGEHLAITPQQLINAHAESGAFALGKKHGGLLTINGFCHSDCDGMRFATANRQALDMLFGAEFMDECDSIINGTSIKLGEEAQ